MMFMFELAERLGRTVGELKRDMSALEFEMWKVWRELAYPVK